MGLQHVLAVLAVFFAAHAAGRAAVPPAPADQGPAAKPAPPPGHSVHGEAFDTGPRQRAYLMKGMGKVHLPVSSNNSEAQLFVDQGVGQLHGFWYFEAERSFRQAAALDANCAMAYWGMALANVNNAGRARSFIQRAVTLKAKASAREKLWIEAYAEYWQNPGKSGSRDDKARRRQLVKRLENIIHEFPQELEAKAFLLFQLWDNTSAGMEPESHEAVDALIKQVLATTPLHPVHHYMIHLWDAQKPARALASAALCGQSAPGIAHMWHMPGHTYAKLERYADAAWQQEASARVDHAHMIRDQVLPDQIHNYAHNNQWLVEDLEYVGRVHDAVELAKNMIEVPRHPLYNALAPKTENSSVRRSPASARAGRQRLFEVLLRFELWDELIRLSESGYLEPTEVAVEQVKRLRARGIACFGKGDTLHGRAEIAALETLRCKLRDERIAAGNKAEVEGTRTGKSREQIARAMADAMLESSDPLQATENALAELEGYGFLAQKDMHQAKASFDKSKDIPKERCARIQLLLGNGQQAQTLGKQATIDGSRQICPLANYVDILFQVGKLKEAGETFQKLRHLAAQADLDVPVMVRLRPLVVQLGLSADWRVQEPPARDVGVRPNLEDLGPRRWQPGPAPDWNLPDAHDKRVSLKDYRGKALIAIFYLGHGCPHCIKQLQVFEPMRQDFAAAGISLVGISTDAMEGVNKTYHLANLPLGVPLLSDSELTAFRAYRAFDDFENTPLHGTFLIDTLGLLRWHDIGSEPFIDGQFLLKEAKRLLALPPSGTLTSRDGIGQPAQGGS
jgi:peroxiredoxin